MKTLIIYISMLGLLVSPINGPKAQDDHARKQIKMTVKTDADGSTVIIDTLIGEKEDGLRVIKLKTSQMESDMGELTIRIEAMLDSLGLDEKIRALHLDEDLHIEMDSTLKRVEVIIKGLEDDMEARELELRIMEKELDKLQDEQQGKEYRVEVEVQKDKDGKETVVKKIILEEEGKESPDKEKKRKEERKEKAVRETRRSGMMVEYDEM